jgi:hypothetical protein
MVCVKRLALDPDVQGAGESDDRSKADERPRGDEPPARGLDRGGLKAARITAADRFVVESVAFALDGDAAQAVEQLEQATREFAGESVILRFGRFWGPGTNYRTPPQPPTIHIDTAGAKAARLLTHAPPATYLVTEIGDQSPLDPFPPSQ